MNSPVAPTSKEEWRRQFRAYRDGLSQPSYATKSALICSRVIGLRAVAEADVAHTYWPQISEREVDTRPLIGALRGQGLDLVLPVVTSYEPNNPEMEHRRYEGPDGLRVNKWGIPEPVHSKGVPPTDLDVVIVPALGAGRNGHRVGHGSGYYDAFLNEVNVPRIILVYEDCLASSVPADAHDVPGTHIVTERKRYRVSDDHD